MARTTAGSWMVAMTRSRPPHRGQVRTDAGGFDLSKLGPTGLKAYALYGHGWIRFHVNEIDPVAA
jgi:hypothetical protein